MAADQSAVEYCSFCGSFVMLESHQENTRLPDYIIPFRKTKEECKTIYRKKILSNPFVPGELRDPDYLNRFSGFYIPYWVYEIGFAEHPTIRGYTEHRDGDYDVKEKFSLTGDLSADYSGLAYDASSTFDDNISARIAPFETKGMRPFSPSYLFGFFADQSDVDSTVYESDAKKLATDEVIDNLMSESGLDEYTLETRSDADLQRQVGTRIKDTKSAMLPVWFLTWRKNDRIAYSVVNGETGKIYAEIPISPVRFLIGTLLISIPVFLFLNLVFLFNPINTMLITAVLSPVAMFLYENQLSRIKKKQEGEGNKGRQSVKERTEGSSMMTKAGWAAGPTRKKQVKKTEKKDEPGVIEGFRNLIKSTLKKSFNSPASFFTSLVTVLIVVTFVLYMIGGTGLLAVSIFNDSSSKAQLILYGLLLLCWLYLIYNGMLLMGILNRGILSRLLVILCCILGLLTPAAIYLAHPVADWWYYGGCICTLLSAAIALLMALGDYNESVTREVPNFFTKAKEERI